MKRYTVFFLAVTAVLAWCVLATGSADAQVTKASLAASPSQFRGNCPGVITFKGSITVNAPGKVRYIFTRSDHAIDTKPKTLIFRAAGTKKVMTTWRLGGSFLPYYTGWQAIKVEAPNSLISKRAAFTLKCNPPADSAISAHGNTDWHVNTANEFLFGKDMAGHVTAANHAPGSWAKTHMHVGLSKTAEYYYDKSRAASGKDTDGTSGIDRAMLFFYAGHGQPTAWSALGESASQSDMKLANIASNGTMRYYWQCSCEVFAHGPKNGTCGASLEYGCPQDFDGSHDSDAMRNVFERWGHVLSPDLRMACGGSTSMWCWNSNVNAVWDDYNNNGMGVAESFIDGFSSSHPGVVPLCITMGGSDISHTPLYTDAVFTNAPNTSGATYYHILYLGGGTQRKPNILKLPFKLPKLMVVAADIPHTLKAIAPTASLKNDLFLGGKVRVRIQPNSGAVYLHSVKRTFPSQTRINDKQLLDRADRLIKDMKWDGKEMTPPVLKRFETASMPRNGRTRKIQHSGKSVLITYSRQIKVNGVNVDVLGRGGKVKVLMTNQGNIISANRVWRRIVRSTADMELKTFEQAMAEAVKKIREPKAYKLDQWKWGYKEPAGDEKISELGVVVQFWFLPKNHEEVMKYPPVFAEVAAEK